MDLQALVSFALADEAFHSNTIPPALDPLGPITTYHLKWGGYYIMIDRRASLVQILTVTCFVAVNG